MINRATTTTEVVEEELGAGGVGIADAVVTLVVVVVVDSNTPLGHSKTSLLQAIELPRAIPKGSSFKQPYCFFLLARAKVV